MTANNLREQLESGILDARLKEIYLTEDPAEERARVKKVLDMYETWLGADPASSQAVETGSCEKQNGGEETEAAGSSSVSGRLALYSAASSRRVSMPVSSLMSPAAPDCPRRQPLRP